MDRPPTAIRCTAGSTRCPAAARTPATVTPPGPPATSASAARREATPASASTFWMRASGIVGTGRRRSTVHQARGRLGIERGQVVERREPEALEELEAGAEKAPPARRVGATQLGDEAAMQQAAHDVIGVHAADALDDAARDRLAVGHDGQRLACRRRQLHALRATVASDERARPGGGL